MAAADAGRIAGRGVRFYREELGLSIYALSRRSGISEAQISMLEKGTRGLSVPTLVALAAALRVEPQWLLELPLELEQFEDMDFGPRSAAHSRVDPGGGLQPTWFEHLGRVSRPDHITESLVDPAAKHAAGPVPEEAYVDPSLHPLRVAHQLRQEDR